MKKIQIFITLFVFLSSSSLLQAQMTDRQAGIRMGYRGGFFYQIGSSEANAEVAYNGLLSFQGNGIQLTGLRIIYESSWDRLSPDIHFSWGYGGHLGYTYSDHIKAMGSDYYFQGNRFCPLLGIDGWLSAEYRIHELPLTVSLNYKPFIEMTIPAFVRVVPWDFALSISYIF